MGVLQQDGRDVIEVFSLQMPRFFEAILENPKLLRVVGTLFGSPSVGRPFAQVHMHAQTLFCWAGLKGFIRMGPVALSTRCPAGTCSMAHSWGLYTCHMTACRAKLAGGLHAAGMA